MKDTIAPTLVEKETIPQLNFKNMVDIDQSPTLMSKLVEATRLGNIHHGKIKINFLDDDGLKSVETTIWATGAKYICLKGGVWLPISRIVEIKNI